MPDTAWKWIIDFGDRDIGDYSLGQFRQTDNKGLLQGYDFDKDKHFIAAFDMPEGMNDKAGITDFLKQNADNLIKSSKDIVDDLADASKSVIDNAFEAFADKLGNTQFMEEAKVLSGGPDLSTNLHINGQTGAVISEAVMEHDTLAKKGLGKLGAVGGVVAAGLAMSGTANAAEAASLAVPGGQSVMAAMEGNQLEAKLLLAEETGVGSLVTEFARPVLRGFGVDVQSGLLEDLFNSATGRDTKLTSIEITNKQSALLQKAGFPDQLEGKPIHEYLKDPANMEKARTMMTNLDNGLGLQALNRFETLEQQMPSAASTQAANLISMGMSPLEMAKGAASYIMTGKLG